MLSEIGKSMLSSKGVIGGALAFVAAIGPMVGLSIYPEFIDQTTLAISQVIGGLSALLSIYGRIVATQVIK